MALASLIEEAIADAILKHTGADDLECAEASNAARIAIAECLQQRSHCDNLHCGDSSPCYNCKGCSGYNVAAEMLIKDRP